MQRLIALAVYTVIFLILVAISVITSSAGCWARWEDSGMRSKWGPIAGCRVQRADGKWIPSENLRDMDLQSREVRP
ncbi:hypothetical protein [Thermomonas sp.]|uniref:hypothetical protein n=1 Tax=Thermomonas sp. TaxID=1971895 RepID=UPI0035B3952A